MNDEQRDQVKQTFLDAGLNEERADSLVWETQMAFNSELRMQKKAERETIRIIPKRSRIKVIVPEGVDCDPQGAVDRYCKRADRTGTYVQKDVIKGSNQTTYVYGIKRGKRSKKSDEEKVLETLKKLSPEKQQEFLTKLKNRKQNV